MTTSSNIESLTTSKTDLNGSTGSFNLAPETTPSPAAVNATSILSQYSAVNASRDRCRRCQQLVYLTERIGPIKDFLYHKLCFKCLKCDRQLDIKTYFTNSMDLSDKEIYCQSHVPRSGKGAVSTDDVQIRSVMKAPKLDVMQRLDDRIKGTSIDSQSVAIAHALKVQLMLHQGREKISSNHKFPALPPDIIHAREEVRRAQKQLEEKQRQEEDQLFDKFRAERELEEKKIDKEVTEEWEKNLKKMERWYEEEMRKKNDKKSERELTVRYTKEKAELEQNMTLKRQKKLEMAQKQITEEQQATTHSLVSKFTKEMLNLIKEKESAELAKSGIDPQDVNPYTMLQSRQVPPPQPPRRRKRDLYEDPSIFDHVDQQAIAVAETEYTSYTELIDQLTSGLLTELEKARAIFRWITVKDLNAIDFKNNLALDTPMGLLRGIKYGTETYHTLFMRLCSYAALHCVDIKGHSKSVGYEPGMHIVEGKFTNTWNAVLIDGDWRFVQCNWGARHLVMNKDKKDGDPVQSKPTREKIKYQYDEHYFLPDPDDFILEFFPYKTEWQLLEKPITLQKFEQLPFVRSLFFHYHLSFVNQEQAIIQSDARGGCDIKLRMPDSLKSRLAFHFHLRFAHSSSTAKSEDLSEFQGIKLERYVLHTVQDDLVSFNVHVPKEGDYFIEIFASLVEPEPNPFGQSFKLKCVCKYRIVCQQVTQRMHPLPACASGEWGPCKAIRHFNIRPLTHLQAIFETSQSLVSIKFKSPKLLKFHGKLHSNQYSTSNYDPNNIFGGSPHTPLDKYITYDYDQENLIITFIIQLPGEGQYGLDLYARDPDYQAEKRTMSHCCKYIINCVKPTPEKTSSSNTYDFSLDRLSLNDNERLPTPRAHSTLQRREVALSPRSSSSSRDSPYANNSTAIPMPKIGGNTSLLSQLGMSPISHPDPSINLRSKNSLDLQFQICKIVDFSFDLIYHQTSNDMAARSTTNLNQHLNASDHVTIKPSGGINVIFALNLPKPGLYTFTIYAATTSNHPMNSSSRTSPNGQTDLPPVFTYLIRYG